MLMPMQRLLHQQEVEVKRMVKDYEHAKAEPTGVRGDVIPKIIEVLGEAKSSDLENRLHADGTPFNDPLPLRAEVLIPEQCPRCETNLQQDGAFIRCFNLNYKMPKKRRLNLNKLKIEELW